MPRYYFHYRDPDEQLVQDRLGSHHLDLDAVEREAQIVAQEILVEEIQEGRPPFVPRCLEIEDEAGEIVLLLPFWAALATLGSEEKNLHRLS